jgi:hypothetical protein
MSYRHTIGERIAKVLSAVVQPRTGRGQAGSDHDASKTLWAIPDAGDTSVFVRYSGIYRTRLAAFLGQRLADIRGNLSQAGADISGHQSREVKALCCARR